jgi:hypothetical protein
MSFTEVFGSATVPSSESKLATFSLTADQTFFWAYNSSDSAYQVADIMEFSTTAGRSITMPPANQVSIGESTLIRNVGANTFTVLSAVGATLGTVAAGVAKLFYTSDNTTVAGVWSVLTFGTGTSAADATTLQGLGLLAIGATLNDSHPVVTTSAAYTITSANRANTLVFTGGSVNCTLPTLATAVNGFSALVKNNGSGTVTFVPQGAETIDQATLVPGESLMLVAGAAGWVTVGYGRTATFAFTRLNKSLTGFGPGTDANLSSTDIANKIINFSGSPVGDTNVIFPSVSSVYYLSSSLTTYAVYVKTASGSSVPVAHGDSVIVVCDGVNMFVALSSSYASNITLPSGTLGALSMKFSASTNTGWYLVAPGTLGQVVNGTERYRSDFSSGAYQHTMSGNLDLGRDPLTGIWTQGSLNVGYGSITVGYNGSTGIQLLPGLSSSEVYLDVTKDSTVHTKAFNLGSLGTTLDIRYPGAAFACLAMDNTGSFAVGKDLLLNGSGGTSSLGFTTGSGGTVTQATSKATAVTLNKSTGKITTAADALAAGASISFVLNNSAAEINDVIVVTADPSGISELSYNIWATSKSGGAYITIKNVSAGSLSQVININFAVIKGSTS